MAARYVSNADKLFREFEAEIFKLKTNAVYLAEELVVLKKEYVAYYGKNVNYALYKQAQRNTIASLTATFRRDLEKANTAAEATLLFTEYVGAVNALPTKTSLYEREKSALISDWSERLNFINTKYSLSADAKISSVLSDMQKETELEAINREGAYTAICFADSLDEIFLEDMREVAEIYIENAVNRAEYRVTEYDDIDAAIRSLKDTLSAANTVSGIYAVIDSVSSELDDIRTDAELTETEQLSFISALHDRYGNKILTLPDLSKASSYDELARIIDYYAFYQLSGSEFLKGTFRVELNFPFRDAQWEINEVYWYCELIRSGAGITGYIEENSNCFVITLIPYEIASVSNTDKPIQISRYNSLVEYGGRKTLLSKRLSDFNDFPYLTKYTKHVSGVWNTQQLWYALARIYPRNRIWIRRGQNSCESQGYTQGDNLRGYDRGGKNLRYILMVRRPYDLRPRL